MTIRFLINDDGIPFTFSELQSLYRTLDSRSNDKRKEYRDQNASAIACHDADKILVVSSPGTGKSHLFLDRINYWFKKDQKASIVVISFVRKLVADLQNEIINSEGITNVQRNKITILTLHKFARSIVEKNNGTTEWQFNPHIRIIGQSWKELLWYDVLAFYPNVNRSVYTWRKFERQLHDNNLEELNEWKKLRGTYFSLCQFYNATGFADLILRATKSLEENPDLNKGNYFIIDEYQDFNLSEEALINQLTNDHKGLLIVGDDEQAIYEELKSSKPSLIRNLYKNKDSAKGMLPFCGRSSYHITKTAEHFIRKNKDIKSIEKIYLPLNTNSGEPKVQVIACATPITAVDYIAKFVADKKAEIDERRKQLEAGEAKDAYLLILTPAKEINFYGQSKEKIKRIVERYQTEKRSFSPDYYRLLSYYSLANKPNNNFTFRKVLHYEKISVDKVHELIDKAMQAGKNLCDLDIREIKNSLHKSKKIKIILEGEGTIAEKIMQIADLFLVTDKEKLQDDIERNAINQQEIVGLEHEEEEEAEMEEIEVKRMGAVELMTVVGSKGLSADHVIILGFDNVNMKWITKNAFYVAITRARNSLHLITALKSGGAKYAHKFLQFLPDDHIEFFSYKKTNGLKKRLHGKRGFDFYLKNIEEKSKPRNHKTK